MAPELLHCYICPRSPDFSDTSHLLTHISSKGHLSHLHKVQVRSHEEAAAGYQLAVYNEWFIDHNIAKLLSERMQQKNRRKSNKRKCDRGRPVEVKRETECKIDPGLLSVDVSPPDVHPYRGTVPYIEKSSQLMPTYGEAGLGDYCAMESSWGHAISSDLVSELLPNNDSIKFETPQSEEESKPTTPESARLKGTIWPGMDIFDSADADTQRKRNQRKDISVLERMQTMSSMVEPMETVCSPGGTIKKKRHIDEIEDDSLVEGESPPVRPSSRRSRRLFVNRRRETMKPKRERGKKTARLAAYTNTSRNGDVFSSADIGLSKLNRRNPVYDTDLASTRPKAGMDLNERGSSFPIFEEPSSVYHEEFSEDKVMQSLLDGLRSYKRLSPSVLLPVSHPLHLLYQPGGFHNVCNDGSYNYCNASSYMEASPDKGSVNPLALNGLLQAAPPSPMPTPFGEFEDFDNCEALTGSFSRTSNPLMNSPSRPELLFNTPKPRLVERY